MDHGSRTRASAKSGCHTICRRGWRPYTYGRWVYTEEWGWYWVSDEEEADWGWVTFHYGRWAHDRRLGWFWVPGDEWGPAWVDWRRGDDYVGWAPLPPDEVVYEYDNDPSYWIFLPPRYLVAPRVRIYFLPPQRTVVVFRRTVIVNRTVRLEHRDHRGRFAVNPGIAPGIVAAAARRPVQTFHVQPRVLASTQGVAGAVQVRPQDLNRPGQRHQRGQPRPGGPSPVQVTLQPAQTVVQPVARVPQPQALRNDERGRLGPTPPRAAQGATVAPSFGAEIFAGATAKRRAAATRRADTAKRPGGADSTPDSAGHCAAAGYAAADNAAPDTASRDDASTAAATARRKPAAGPQRSAPATADDRAANPATSDAAVVAATSTATATARTTATIRQSAATATAADHRAANSTAGDAAVDTATAAARASLAAASAAAATSSAAAAAAKAGPTSTAAGAAAACAAAASATASCAAAAAAAAKAPAAETRREAARAPEITGVQKTGGRFGRPSRLAYPCVVQCSSTFLNCQASRLSMSSGKSPGRPVRGVQSV